MNAAFSEMEFDRARENISQDVMAWNQGKMVEDIDSTTPDIHPTKKSIHSIVPIERNQEAIFEWIANEPPEILTQFRTTSSQNRNELSTGVSSPDEGAHLTKISVETEESPAEGIPVKLEF